MCKADGITRCGYCLQVEQAREFLQSALDESDADERAGGAGWDVEVDARTVLGLLNDPAPVAPNQANRGSDDAA